SGIIKHNTPVVVAPQPYGDQAYSVIADVASQHSANVLDVRSAYKFSAVPNDIYTQQVVVSGDNDEYSFKLPLVGAHQVENATTAIAASETLNGLGFELSRSNIEDGLEAVHWPARLQVLQDEGPILMVDGAHNTHSASSLVKTIEEMRRSGILQINRVILIFGVLSGHDSVGVLEQFGSFASVIVPVSSRHPRSTSSDLLGEQAQKLGVGLVQHSGVTLTVREGVELALSVAGINDLVLATGSISVAAEVIEWKENIVPEVYSNIPTGIENRGQRSQ
ncbi:MAG: cyanophycin synthetase, partial [Chloroflexota bacterium]|nr:cyanophycin synthetase [Chloroflexota bacterium]